MPRKSEHHLLTGHTRRVFFVVIGKKRKSFSSDAIKNCREHNFLVISFQDGLDIACIIFYTDAIMFIFIFHLKTFDKNTNLPFLAINVFNKRA